MTKISKKLLILAAFAIPVFFMSYASSKPERAELSKEAPEIVINTGDTTLSLKKLRGQTVVLHFWSKDDAQSRIDNHFNDKHTEEDNIVYVSICTDKRDENLSRIISKSDGNRDETQYYMSELQPSSNLDAYLSEGNATWVISPEGMLTAKF